MIDAYEFINKVYETQRDVISRDYDRVASYIQKLFTFKVHNFRTGKKCGGWKVPESWHLHSAYIKDGRGNEVLGLDTPLRVMRYSASKSGFMKFDELRCHIKVDATLPEAIPYVTNPFPPYDWAFCMTLQEFAALDREDTYYVHLDSEFGNGDMKVLEYHHKGKFDSELLFTAHLDGVHQADYGLSGVAMILYLIEYLKNRRTQFSYRFIIGPQTIGPVAYLSENPKAIGNITGAVDLDFMGNNQLLKIQRSNYGSYEIDDIAMELKRNNIVVDGIWDFGVGNPNLSNTIASDALIYNSFGIPMISMFRLPYRNLHTDLDDIRQINEISLEESFEKLLELIEIFETNKTMVPVTPGPIFLDPEDFPENLLPPGFNFFKFCSLYEHDTILNVAQEMKVLYCDLVEIVKMLEYKKLIKTTWE